MCYYCDGLIIIADFDLHNFLLDQKLYEIILIYDVS